jgi:hypothetical protein
MLDFVGGKRSWGKNVDPDPGKKYGFRSGQVAEQKNYRGLFQHRLFPIIGN